MASRTELWTKKKTTTDSTIGHKLCMINPIHWVQNRLWGERREEGWGWWFAGGRGAFSVLRDTAAAGSSGKWTFRVSWSIPRWVLSTGAPSIRRLTADYYSESKIKFNHRNLWQNSKDEVKSEFHYQIPLPNSILELRKDKKIGITLHNYRKQLQKWEKIAVIQ